MLSAPWRKLVNYENEAHGVLHRSASTIAYTSMHGVYEPDVSSLPPFITHRASFLTPFGISMTPVTLVCGFSVPLVNHLRC